MAEVHSFESPSKSPETENKASSGRSRPSWLWFAAGFLAVFVGMALFVTMFSMHPSGEFVVQYKLWQYYFVEIPRTFAVRNLGPGSSSASPFFILIQHVLASAVGGGIAFGLVWAARKFAAKS